MLLTAGVNISPVSDYAIVEHYWIDVYYIAQKILRIAPYLPKKKMRKLLQLLLKTKP